MGEAITCKEISPIPWHGSRLIVNAASTAILWQITRSYFVLAQSTPAVTSDLSLLIIVHAFISFLVNSLKKVASLIRRKV